MSLSDDCPPFSTHGKKDKTAPTDVLSPRLGQFQIIWQSTILARVRCQLWNEVGDVLRMLLWMNYLTIVGAMFSLSGK
jgi:hypothetical protein